MRGAVRRVVAGVQVRQRALEARVERRWPRLYDSRHAVEGVGRLVWPLVGPIVAAVLFALVVAPIIALLAGLIALLHLAGLTLPRLPDVDLPGLPDVHLPGWLRSVLDAVGDVVSSIAGALADASEVLKWPIIVALVIAGLFRSRAAMRRRAEAEAIGEAELRRRLLARLSAVEAKARAADGETVGAVARPGLLDRLAAEADDG